MRPFILVVLTAIVLLILAAGCGSRDEPIAAEQFCSAARPAVQRILDQWDVIVPKLDSLNTLNVIAVSRSLASDSSRLDALTDDVRAISTNIIPDGDKNYDDLAEAFDDATLTMSVQSTGMAGFMHDYSRDFEGKKLDWYISSAKDYQDALGTAYSQLLGICEPS